MKANKIYLEETASTNAVLKDLLKSADVEEGTTIYTGFQTAGRGQKGTAWESERGKNLLFSLVLYPNFVKANEQFIISQLVSLSIKEALDKYAIGICIKWPNDIYHNDRKICGILIENELLNDIICASIIGVGLNVNQKQFVSDAPNPVSLKQITETDYNLENLLDELLENLFLFYQSAKTGKDSIAEKYRQSLWRKEGFHRFGDKDGEFLAQIKEVTPTGRLTLVTPDGTEKSYAFKEVRFI